MSEKTKTTKKERMIEAAAQLFANDDFHKVQMDRVAEKAQVAKGTLYNHFRSKEELYFCIIRSRLENLLLLLENAFDEREDVIKNLRSFATHFYVFMLKYPSFYLIWKKEQGRLNSDKKGELDLIRRKIKELLKEVLEEGIKNGTFKKTNIDSVADFILGILDAGVYGGLSKGLTPYNSKRHRDFVFNFILEGIKN